MKRPFQAYTITLILTDSLGDKITWRVLVKADYYEKLFLGWKWR